MVEKYALKLYMREEVGIPHYAVLDCIMDCIGFVSGTKM